MSSIGALICGRTLFDVTNGWNGRHTFDVPVVLVTHHVPNDWVAAHPDAPFSFITDGVAAAVLRAKGLAGDRDVLVSGGTTARQFLDLHLLDEVAVDLVPIIMAPETVRSSGSFRPRTSYSANPLSAFKGTASLIWCSR